MSLIAPNPTRTAGKKQGGARRAENNRIYGNPLPLIFLRPEETARYAAHHILGLFGLSSARALNPHCEGVFDPDTRSVWVSNSRDSTILWQRGFFGKGDLSRSEPSWQARQINAREAAGKYMTSEEVREKRRAERKQFKLDRADAIAKAAAEAEAAFAAGRQAESTVAIPSGATWKPHTSATDTLSADPPSPSPGPDADDEPDPVPEIEHLQLTLQEAFFLAWCLDCLTVLDPGTNEPMSLPQIWAAFQNVHCMPRPPDPCAASAVSNRTDNPFFVHYAAYHYYRSLGWVVKGGVKFCVDFLLYKRGPVFNHAEFAIVVLPVYEDPADQEASPFAYADTEPFSWSWLSTINRVNSQVQKTLILTYVTIPAQSRYPSHLRSSPARIVDYSVREVVLRRFIPARMRD
ncbi:hypothetical protein B0H21DRAFT_698568 [Amylocystis lapponica]|nr:hypothetical protein B0H21DRAFT_698568 [Amylocystis lapponica]